MDLHDSTRSRRTKRSVIETRSRRKAAPEARKEPKQNKVKCNATPILHFLSTKEFASPFDINMAVDSGFEVVVTHTGVGLADTTALVHDAIFSRPPEYGRRTGLFIGGKDALLALDMLAAAKAALVPPFELSAFADPGGSFTTAAAMVALVEKVYREQTGRSLENARVAVFGATGVVGFAASIIAAQCGAKVRMISHIGIEVLEPAITAGQQRFGVELEGVLGARDEDKLRIISEADIVLCAAAAGVRVLTARHLKSSRTLAVVADVNAVPPSGIDGVQLFDRGQLIEGTEIASVGPLAIGDIKYKTQAALFRNMVNSEKALMLDFTNAFAMARTHVDGSVNAGGNGTGTGRKPRQPRSVRKPAKPVKDRKSAGTVRRARAR